jgi:hypothetical protein
MSDVEQANIHPMQYRANQVHSNCDLLRSSEWTIMKSSRFSLFASRRKVSIAITTLALLLSGSTAQATIEIGNAPKINPLIIDDLIDVPIIDVPIIDFTIPTPKPNDSVIPLSTNNIIDNTTYSSTLFFCADTKAKYLTFGGSGKAICKKNSTVLSIQNALTDLKQLPSVNDLYFCLNTEAMDLFLPSYATRLTGGCLEKKNTIYVNEIDPIKFPKDHHYICADVKTSNLYSGGTGKTAIRKNVQSKCYSVATVIKGKTTFTDLISQSGLLMCADFGTNLVRHLIGNIGGCGNNAVTFRVAAQGQASKDGKTLLNGIGGPANTLGQPGDMYIDTQTFKIYGPKNFDGTWSTGVGIIGPKGAPGLIGPKGDQGLAGPQGPQGPGGATGSRGDVGARGVPGIQGEVGAKGDTGETGAGTVAGFISPNVGPAITLNNADTQFTSFIEVASLDGIGNGKYIFTASVNFNNAGTAGNPSTGICYAYGGDVGIATLIGYVSGMNSSVINGAITITGLANNFIKMKCGKSVPENADILVQFPVITAIKVDTLTTPIP